MKNLRVLVLAAMLICGFLSVRTYLHEFRSPWFDLSQTRAELQAIQDRDQLFERVDGLVSALQKADVRIHDWRTLTARTWGLATFLLAMVMVGTFVWNKESALNRRIHELEQRLAA